ncbi:MAG: gamma-aminobutyrate permease, partial [Staphylococcus warneri]|nr:gamma-aminobutyrate permease [Staphylococcus warneri]
NKTTKLPIRSILTTYLLVVAVVIYANFNSNAVFNLLNIIGSMVIIIWGSSIWAQIRVRRAIKKQGKDANELLPYKAPFYPFGPIVVIATLLFLLFGSSFGSIASGDWISVIRNFTPILILAIIFFVHKMIKKTKFVKLEEMDLSSHIFKNN